MNQPRYTGLSDAMMNKLKCHHPEIVEKHKQERAYDYSKHDPGDKIKVTLRTLKKNKGYEGEWVSGKCGRGAEINENGTLYEGYWKDG